MPDSIVYFPLKWSCHMKRYIDIKHAHDVFRAVERLLFAKHRKCYGIPLNKCWLVVFKPLSKISIRIWLILAMRGEFQWAFSLCMLNLVFLNPCIDSYLTLLLVMKFPTSMFCYVNQLSRYDIFVLSRNLALRNIIF